MNILPILKYPSPSLTEQCFLVTFPLEEYVFDLIKQMNKTLKYHRGLGLAAPQVGHNLKIFVTKYPIASMVINPIVQKHGEKIKSNEGCLSIPGKRFTVERYSQVDLMYYDIYGNFNTKWYIGGEEAIVIQHEYDHLHGILINRKNGEKNVIK